MALVNVQHNPITAKARQFDGTLDALLDILGARPKAGLTFTGIFNGAEAFSTLTVAGGSLGGTITLNLNDWIVFPPELAKPAYKVPAAEASNWTVIP